MRRNLLWALGVVTGLLLTCAGGLWAHACLRRGVCGLGVGSGGRALFDAARVVGGVMLVAIALRATWLLVATARAVGALPARPTPPALAASASRAGAARVVCLRDDDALAFSTGVLRSRLYITDTLVARLRADELAGVVAHEDAHARRRDPVRRALRRATREVVFFLPVLTWWDRYQGDRAELTADRNAIRLVGAPALAGALWVVGNPAADPMGSGFGDAAASRVAQLLRAPGPRSRPRVDELARSGIGGVAALAFLVCSAPLFS